MAEIANKLFGLKSLVRKYECFLFQSMPMLIPGLNYLQSQSFLLESDWIVFLIQDPC